MKTTFLWVITTVLTLFIIGCGGDVLTRIFTSYDDEEANEWVGSWTMQSVDEINFDQDIELEEGGKLSTVTNDWTFTDDGKVVGYLIFQTPLPPPDPDGMVEVSITITGTYTLSGDTYTLTLTIEDPSHLFDESFAEETGTWVREGNALTLNDNDGQTLVFKKK